MDCSIRICVWKSPGGSNEQETTTTRASSSRRAPGRCGEERPEEKINWLLVLEMFFTNAASSVGTVGFVWATVVLLGGFVTKLNPVDFWFITTLSFFQAIRIIGGDWNAEKTIISDLLIDNDSFKKCRNEDSKRSKAWSFLQTSKDKLTNAIAYCAPEGLDYNTLLTLGRYLCKTSAFIVRLLRYIVPVVWAALSFPHLLLQNFGDIGRSAEDINMKAALNLYYGLSVGQALLSIIAINHSYSSSKLLKDVAKQYELNVNGERAMDLYYRHVRRICRDEGMAKTLNMTLIGFAVKSLASNHDKEAQKAGLTILHDLVEMEYSRYSTEALQSVRDCPDAIESLSNVVVSTFEDDKPTRVMAAWVMAKLAAHLHVHGILPVMRSVWSLLEARDGEMVTSNDKGMKFTERGLEILEQLSSRACNLSAISSSHELMAKLTAFTCVPALSSRDDFSIRKARCALTVFSRFASCTGIQGINIRQDILENTLLLANIGEIIMQGSTTSDLLQLQEGAIGIVDGFALDAGSRDHRATRKLVVMLLGVFRSLDEGDKVQVQLSAGKALARLTTDSQANCHAIIREKDVLKDFKRMLSGQHGASCRVVVANILRNLCAYAKPDSMKEFSAENISMAITTMCQTKNVKGEDMEALLGLVLQFSKLLPADDFSMAVNGNGIGLRNFVEKLKSILEEANSEITSTSTHPGIRRFAIEQVIWMAQSEPQLHCINHFIDFEMRDYLVEVQQTARRTWQENFKLSSGDLPVLEYEESLHSVALRALDLIPGEQINGQ